MGKEASVKRIRKEMRRVMREEAMAVLDSKNKRLFISLLNTRKKSAVIIALLFMGLVGAVISLSLLFFKGGI